VKALVASKKGGTGQLEYRDDVPVPYLGIGDVQVRVDAASFTPGELDWPSNWVDRSGRDRHPVVPGHELSGVVEALGSGTTGVGIGDAVYGLTDWYRSGTAADYVSVEARDLALKPASLDHNEAAAVPMAGLTAWQALFLHGGLKRGQTVVILGAAGGVGSFAVQLAHSAGAHVIGTGFAGAAEHVAELGADEFVNVDQQELRQVVRDADLVLDLAGGDALAQSWEIVASGGTVVSPVEEKPTAPDRDDVRGIYFVVEPRSSELADLARRIDAGELRPVIGQIVPLAEGQRAFEARGIRGKRVLEVHSQPPKPHSDGPSAQS
jgi:NADPH:quinone reductase-like Zn-dependent oxidoreductase